VGNTEPGQSIHSTWGRAAQGLDFLESIKYLDLKFLLATHSNFTK
jgi:hypothetical protein